MELQEVGDHLSDVFFFGLVYLYTKTRKFTFKQTYYYYIQNLFMNKITNGAFRTKFESQNSFLRF